jgi:hypothetical protein
MLHTMLLNDGATVKMTCGCGDAREILRYA